MFVWPNTAGAAGFPNADWPNPDVLPAPPEKAPDPDPNQIVIYISFIMLKLKYNIS